MPVERKRISTKDSIPVLAIYAQAKRLSRVQFDALIGVLTDTLNCNYCNKKASDIIADHTDICRMSKQEIPR
jgi:hypothetical protein